MRWGLCWGAVVARLAFSSVLAEQLLECQGATEGLMQAVASLDMSVIEVSTITSHACV